MVILKHFKSFSVKNSFRNSTVITEETHFNILGEESQGGNRFYIN